MKVEATYTMPAPRERVWAVLMDPRSIQECLPGCEELKPLGDDTYQAVMRLGVANIKGTYRGRVTIADRDEPNSYRMLVEGSGPPGFVKGEGRITLAGEGATTVVRVEGEARIGGTIAAVGQRLLPTVAKMLMNNFFNCVQKKATAP